MICIYHNKDLDGYTSGAIVAKWHDEINDYPDNVGKGELKLIGYDYSEKFPWDQIPAGEKIIMIDVSLKMPEMCKLSVHSGQQLTWIDHHISAINEYNNYKDSELAMITAVLQDGIAACEIGWEYFFNKIEIPKSVKLLGKYDTWRNNDKVEWNNEILPFQFGMRQICNSPESFPSILFQHPELSFHKIEQIINNGNAIVNYQESVNESLCKKSAFETEFEGYRAICLNAGMISNETFKSVYDETKHDIMVGFQFDGNTWTFSLRATKAEVNCSEIAKKHGGGGHKGAAGFQSKNLIDILVLAQN